MRPGPLARYYKEKSENDHLPLRRGRASRRHEGAHGVLAIGFVLGLTLAGAFPLQAHEVAWAVRAGGSGFEEGRGIATDGANNSYVAGRFTGTMTFGAGEANQTTFTAEGLNDIFLAKYGSNGSLVWAKRASGTGFEQALAIATDDDGNSYITGLFDGTATFGAGEANEVTLTNFGNADLFVAKYDPDGGLVWVKRAGDSSFSVISLGIATDGSGSTYVTGHFADTATFGAGEINQTTLTAAGSRDIFVAMYNPDGSLAWADRAGGTGADEGHGIATDSAGNSYVTGSFGATATFGAGDSQRTLMASGESMFVVKYDSGGTLIWADSAGGGGVDGSGIATDSTGDSYITGMYRDTATFAAGTVDRPRSPPRAAAISSSLSTTLVARSFGLRARAAAIAIRVQALPRTVPATVT